jgi:CRISPR-associated protein Cmr1
MKFILKTLTPIWTGGMDSTSSQLRETGIIGSLRWWYEAVVRGLGGYACDPSLHDGCSFDSDAYKKLKTEEVDSEILRKVGLCDACQAYGATGWRRKFKIELSGGSLAFEEENPVLIPSGRIRVNKQGRDRAGGWYIGNGLVGDITLQVHPLKQDWEASSLLVPMLIAEKWGGLGAKTQLGFGVFTISSEGSKALQPNVNGLIQLLPMGSKKDYGLPNLRHFFFAKLQFEAREDWWKKTALLDKALAKRVQDESRQKNLNDISQELGQLASRCIIPIAPTFKNWLRFGKRITTRQGKSLEVSVIGGIKDKLTSDELFGFSDKEDHRKAGLINMSSAYLKDDNRWEIRVWGWVPPSQRYDRDEVLEDLNDLLKVPANWQPLLGSLVSNTQLVVWREFDSARDTVRRIIQATEYLKSLLSRD